MQDFLQKSANHIAKELGRLHSGFYSSEDFLNFVQSKLNPEFVQLETAQLENIQKTGCPKVQRKSVNRHDSLSIGRPGRCRICDESFYEPDFDCRIQEETDSAGNGPEIAWRILRFI